MRPTWVSDDDGRHRRTSWTPFSWQSVPATGSLIVAAVLLLLGYVFLGQNSGPVWAWIPLQLGGQTDLSWAWQVWRWFTYPLLNPANFWLVIALWLLYSYGGLLERAWGSVNLAALFFVFSAVGAVSMGIGSVLTNQKAAVLGLSMPLAALVTAWAALDPEADCNVWGVIQIKAKFLGAIWVALLFWQSMGVYGPLLTLFSLAPPAFAFYYVRKMSRLNLSFGRRPDRWAPDLRDDRPRREERPRRRPTDEREKVGGFNPLRRRQEQAEIERLRKLLGDDDDRPITRN